MDSVSIIQALENWLEKDNSKIYVVGFSGGPDSLCLVHALFQKKVDFIAAHLNHQLRKTSKQEADELDIFCKRLGVKFVSHTEDILRLAEQTKRGNEETARDTRYHFLFQIAQTNNASAVVTAHTKDDQAETILMHFIRGCGLEGLSGMQRTTLTQYHPTIPLCRPFLKISRDQTEAYCKEFGLKPIFDESNKDTRYTRNWVRHEILPVIKNRNPDINDSLLRLAEIVNEENVLIEEIVSDAYQTIAKQTLDGIVLRRGAFGNCSISIQRRILRRVLKQSNIQSDVVDFNLVEEIRQRILKPPKTKTCQPNSQIVMWFEGDNVIFSNESDINYSFKPHILIAKPEKNLKMDGNIFEAHGILVRTKIFTNSETFKLPKDKESFSQYFDAEKISWPLEIRGIKTGDRFAPLGMCGKTQKISDYLINNKIPKRKRNKVLLLTSKGAIVWIIGHQIAETARISKDTQEILQISIDLINC